MVRGENLLREIDGVRQRYGFFTNVFVEAFTPTDAESRAIEILRADANLGALNVGDDPMKLTAEEIHEMESFEGFRLPRQGLSLYEENSNDDSVM
jgi:hypothetical protein